MRMLPISGLKGPFGCLNRARYGIGWGAMGAAEFCYEAARNYTLERKQFGRPLAANQIVQLKLANMLTEISLGLQAALRVGRLIDDDAARPRCNQPPEAQQLRQGARYRPRRAAATAGNGVSAGHHVIRHAVNLEAVQHLRHGLSMR